MNALTIQNCENLTLYNSFKGAHVMIEHRYLYVFNITEVLISSDSSNFEQSEYFSHSGDGRSVHQTGDTSLKCLPSNVFLENITKFVSGSHPVYKDECVGKGVTLKSLQLINVNMSKMENQFLYEPSTLRELKMARVRIGQVENEARPPVIVITNKKAIIEISDSTIEEIPQFFLRSDVSKVSTVRPTNNEPC